MQATIQLMGRKDVLGYLKMNRMHIRAGKLSLATPFERYRWARPMQKVSRTSDHSTSLIHALQIQRCYKAPRNAFSFFYFNPMVQLYRLSVKLVKTGDTHGARLTPARAHSLWLWAYNNGADLVD